MTIKNIFFIPLALISLSAFSIEIKGRLEFDNKFLIRTTQNDILDINISKKYQKYLASMTESFFQDLESEAGQKYPNYYLSFEGIIKNQELITKQTPKTMSAPKKLSGILKEENGVYKIGLKAVRFEESPQINGTSFDESTIRSYLNKDVSVLIKTNDSHESIVTAIVPRYLYSAKDSDTYVPRHKLIKDIITSSQKEKVSKYLLKTVYKNKISQKGQSFRQTIFKNKPSVAPGEKALIITLGGRQGDDPAALAGHLAAGMATVKDDLSLDMELWNYYPVPNEKLIISGHNHFIDYFGHVTAGQVNYRPVYTLILYGVDEKVMKKMRDELDYDFYNMRENLKEFGANYNCTTETVSALRKQGFNGKLHTGIAGHIFKKLGALLLTPFEILSLPFTRQLSELRYSVQKDPNRYLPRAAFNGYLKNLNQLKQKFGITRADYVFQAQNKSKRLLGGAPSISPLNIFYGKSKVQEILENPQDWPFQKVQDYIESLMRGE